MVKTLTVKAVEDDTVFGKKFEGTWFKDDGFQILDEDADVYGEEADGTKRLLGKFRKSVIPGDLVQKAWDAFRKAAIPTRNRGPAAGPIDLKGAYWSRRKPVKTSKWLTQYMHNGKLSNMRVSNNVASGVMGFYDGTPSLKLPCRMTTFSRNHMELVLHGMPFLKRIDELFAKLTPEAHAKQLAAIKKHPLYQIDNTAFSTITVNNTFRTALHKDTGDFKEGFGNLSVIEWGKYHGGFTVLPRFKIGFDVRTGDFLAMDVHEWHTNTPMMETAEDKAYNKTLPDIRSRDPAVGVAGSTDRFQRLSFVCYYREKIMECEEAETKAYYKKEGFDEKEALKEAKDEEPVSLPLPGVTATLEETWKAFEETSAGKAARMLQTRKNRQKTEGTRKVKRA